ncbi:MAG: EVE domain-containing protein, partial [Prochlorococcaceae cyanobacterium ETNP14_MAG_4]|nr:EVE domain-containing protein [Prochlorococcaceae cyanobacterium ETNP14_MAG_4]
KLRDRYSAEELPVVRKGNRLSILPVPKSTATDLLQWLGPLN